MTKLALAVSIATILSEGFCFSALANEDVFADKTISSSQQSVQVLPGVGLTGTIRCKDGAETDSMNYLPLNCLYHLSLRSPKKYSLSSLKIVRNADGTAIMQVETASNVEPKVTIGLKSYKPNKGWVPLTKPQAIELFGTPVTLKLGAALVSTFDVYTSPAADEKNLFHIDIQFDSNGNAVAYRVRGIGIVNPGWSKQ